VDLADFFPRGTNAAKLAQEAGRIKRLDEFRKPIGQLREASNGCHERYLKTERPCRFRD
jgi:hypothetical protein